MPATFEFPNLRTVIRSTREAKRLRKVFLKYRDYTMVPEHVYIGNLKLAESIVNVSGAIVECGTWRGGMIAGIADVLGPARKYWLFDSFEGLPPAREIDGPAAIKWQSETTGHMYHNNCRASEAEAERAMSLGRAEDVTIVKGWFRHTLRTAKVGSIALLRMDADWYDSTKEILEFLAPSVVSGGIIIVDDYYVYDGCALAVNEYAAERNWMIRQYWLGGVCHIAVR